MKRVFLKSAICLATVMTANFNIAEFREKMEKEGDTFTDHFNVDNDQLVWLDQKKTGKNHTVQENEVIMRCTDEDDNVSYRIVSADDYENNYMELAEEKEAAQA